ncbi:MAG: non-ribosomal peptide synthetase, partial [Chloroflexi bacterium]|nr:non-ribosomal peptide synthetase [Chloroflexota bacterium]
RQWAEMGGEFPKLRLIRLEGDQTLTGDVEIYKKHFASNCFLVNGLGATECGIVRQYFINQHTEVHSIVPIGYDVEDMDVFLHDNEGQPVPINTVGEIVVKSKYLSQGYWRDPKLTQSAFSLERREGNQRIYRTGDLGRMQPDGCLTYLGRSDSQVKIRGHRVEIADVESALLEVEDVKEAIVLALEDRPGVLRLIAYLVPSTQPAPTPSSLRRALEIRLPQHMIPSAYMILDALPLTAVGKVNRRSLPKPGNQRPQLDYEYEAPRTPTEVELGRIWMEVLGLGEVVVYDRFLDLGGDSLLGIKVVSRIVRAFQIEVPLRSLFDAPTISEMAIIINQYLFAHSDQDELGQFLIGLESQSEKPVSDSNEID